MELPINQQELDDIIYKVAQDYIETKAIEGKMEDLDPATAQVVIDDVVFIVESYMRYTNDYIEKLRLQQINISN